MALLRDILLSTVSVPAFYSEDFSGHVARLTTEQS